MARPTGQHRIEGVVRSAPDGAPMAGVVVSVYPARARRDAPSLGEGRTDAAGAFRIAFRRTDEARRIARAFPRGPALRLRVHDRSGMLLHEAPARTGKARFAPHELRVPAAGARGDGLPPDPEMRRLGISSLRAMRAADAGALAARRRAGRMSEATVSALQDAAHVAVATGDLPSARRLVAKGLRTVSQLADAPAADIKRVLRGTDGAAAVETVQERAWQLRDALARTAVATASLAPAQCRECADDCCGASGSIALTSKAAYLAYLVRCTGQDAATLGRQLHQDFVAPSCEAVPLVRIGIDVLEQALLAGEFAGASATKTLRRMVAYRAVVWRSMVARIGRATPDRQRAGLRDFGASPIQGRSLGNDARLADARRALDAAIDALSRWLRANTPLDGSLIDSAWLRASGQDIAAARGDLGSGWTRELTALGAATPAAPVPDLAVRHRSALIQSCGLDTSQLRERYHVNFAGSEVISWCDQAIVTLQEVLRCGRAWYVACCSADGDPCAGAGDDANVSTRFRSYDEYRAWIEQSLHPQHFYDLHLKTPLVRGDTDALHAELGAAKQALDGRLSGNDELAALGGLFDEGFAVIDELLAVDALIATGHQAYRDEEYGLAIADYEQARARIAAHVERYYSAKLATYEELFIGVAPDCAGESDRVRDAATLLDALQTASLRPALLRQLINPGRLQPMETASAFWPSGGLLPTLQDLQTVWNEVQSDPATAVLLAATLGAGGAVVAYFVLSKLQRREVDLDALRASYGPSGWGVVDAPNGQRMTPPLILRQDMFSQPGVSDQLGTAFQELLVHLAFPRIQGKLGELAQGVAADVDGLRTCLTTTWGTADITILDVAVQIVNTVGCIAQFAGSVASTFDTVFLDNLIQGCKHDHVVKLHGHEILRYPVLDPVCIVNTIVDRVTTAVRSLPSLNFNSPQDLLASLESLPADAMQAVNDGITEWLGADWTPAALEGLLANDADALGRFANTVISLLMNEIVVDDESAWIVRDGAIRESSSLHTDAAIRDRTKLRMGTILFDQDAAGDPSFSTYSAQFKIHSETNRDIGVVFRFAQDASGAPTYYLLAMRNGDGEELLHEAGKLGMEAAWSMLVLELFAMGVEAIGLLAAAPAAFSVWLAGIVAAEFAWDEVFPPDRAGSFVRLLKVRAGADPVVLYDAVQPKLEQGQDYAIKVDVADRDDGSLAIQVAIGKPAADPTAVITVTDATPLGPGGVGLHAFGNDGADFLQADVTYYPAGTGTLGRLLFAPQPDAGEQFVVDPKPYTDRLTCPADDPAALARCVSLCANDFDVVQVQGPTDRSEAALDAVQADAVDLSPFRITDAPTIPYRLFDPVVDRRALAHLLDGLSDLLPHLYFFVLPLSIADAFNAAGDYERAKRHYDVILDCFPNEVERSAPAGTSAAALYGDPAARRVGYSFLHVDVPGAQAGIEEALLEARQAANELAAGVRAFTIGDPESRRAAYESFERVLLVFGQTRCCTNWDGTVGCVPGAATTLPPPANAGQTPGTSGASQPPSTNGNGTGTPGGLPAELEKCPDLVRELERRLASLDPAKQRSILESLRGRTAKNRGAPAVTCDDLRRLLASLAAEDRAQRGALVSAVATPAASSATALERRFPAVVDRFETGGPDGQIRYVRQVALARTAPALSAATERGEQPLHRLRHAIASGSLLHAPGNFTVGSLTPTIGAAPSDGAGRCVADRDRTILADLLGAFTCVAPDPLVRSLTDSACLYLQRLDLGLNVLGLPQDEVPPYRYEYLLNLSRTFAGFAASAERDFLQFREKLSSARLSVMQQEHSLELLGAQTSVKSLAVDQAGILVDVNDLQVAMTQRRDQHLDELLTLNDAQMVLAVLGGAAGAAQGMLGLAAAGVGVVGAAAGVAAAIPTGGLSLVGSVAGLGVAALGVGQAGASAAGGVVGGITGVFNAYEQRVMLEQQQDLLRNFEQPIAQLNRQSALLAQRMAVQELAIAQLELDFAARVLTYLSRQFLNGDMYAFLARQSKQNYRRYLAYARELAYLAERALERDLGRTLSMIQTDYFDVSVQGLTGGDSLLEDIATLEYQQVASDDTVIYPPYKLYSLAATVPLEFEQFRRTGRLYFRTDHLDFDREFPGHYYRKITSVRVVVLGLVGADGVKATLTQFAPTEIVVPVYGDFVQQTFAGATQRAPLVPAADGRGLVPLNPDSSRLAPFEGTGVAATWLLEILPGANRWDLSTVADIQVIVEYSAREDAGYRDSVVAGLESREWRTSRALRLRLEYPDAFYRLLNPTPSAPALTSDGSLNVMTVSLTTDDRRFGANEQQRRLTGISLAFFDRSTSTVMLDKCVLAARTHVEMLWRARALDLILPALSAAAAATSTRVIRAGLPTIVPLGQVMPGEVASAGAWNRVLRRDRMVWVPSGQEQANDVLPTALDTTTTPLPAIVPGELVMKAQVPFDVQDVAAPAGGSAQRYFDLRVRDDGTPPSPGLHRTIRNGDLVWVANLRTGEQELPVGDWVRSFDGTDFTWVAAGASGDVAGEFLVNDTWYVTTPTAANAEYIAAAPVAGLPVLDLNAVDEAIFAMHYQYHLLPAR